VAVGIASKAAGSKIMICTDGKANCGVGNVEKNSSFYSTVSNLARKQGVSISVITMEGEDCSMENLGTASDISGGSVEIVDPLHLSTKVVTLMNKKTVATGVTCTILLNEHLNFRNEEKGILSKVTKEIGTVTDETDLTFSIDWSEEAKAMLEKYHASSKEENKEERKEDSLIQNFINKGLPVQIRLMYTRMTGEKYIKVVTAQRPITMDRDKAENDIDSTVVSLQAIHESAKMAQQGNYTDARINLVSVQRLLQRAMKTPKHQKDYMSYIVQAEKLDQFMRESQQQQSVLGSRAKDRDDDAAKSMFQMKSVSVKAFNERR
jgi:hypothetical protein